MSSSEEGAGGVIKVPPHHPGAHLASLGLDPSPWGMYRPFTTVLPGYLPLPSPLLINRFAGK